MQIIIIQSKAIKIINNQPLFASLSSIESNLVSLTERFNQLNFRYISNAMNNKNELIIQLWSEYLNMSSGGRVLSYQTLFCSNKEKSSIGVFVKA